MPFANYKDFADCVSKNKDKKSPEGYCAVVHKKATGKYPSEHWRGRLERLHESLLKEDHLSKGIFPMEQFVKGLKIEQEHSGTVKGDPITVAKIVLDHLAEDEYYYDKLPKNL